MSGWGLWLLRRSRWNSAGDGLKIGNYGFSLKMLLEEEHAASVIEGVKYGGGTLDAVWEAWDVG